MDDLHQKVIVNAIELNRLYVIYNDANLYFSGFCKQQAQWKKNNQDKPLQSCCFFDLSSFSVKTQHCAMEQTEALAKDSALVQYSKADSRHRRAS